MIGRYRRGGNRTTGPRPRAPGRPPTAATRFDSRHGVGQCGPVTRPSITGAVLDHIAHAVPRWEDAWPRYVTELGASGIPVDPAPGFAPAQLRFANRARLEVLMPNDVESNDFLDRFLRTNGPGAHHLTFKVPDLEEAIGHCRESDSIPSDLSRRPLLDGGLPAPEAGHRGGGATGPVAGRLHHARSRRVPRPPRVRRRHEVPGGIPGPGDPRRPAARRGRRPVRRAARRTGRGPGERPGYHWMDLRWEVPWASAWSPPPGIRRHSTSPTGSATDRPHPPCGRRGRIAGAARRRPSRAVRPGRGATGPRFRRDRTGGQPRTPPGGPPPLHP